MRYRFFTNSERAWRAMFKEIESSKEYIYLEMYIFTNDMIQYDFLVLLKEKAAQGVRVRIILDSFGSRALNNGVITELRESGAEVFFLNYFFHRMHRKILVVDGKRAFIGGVNLSQRFRFWDDLVVEVKGKRLLRRIVCSFSRVYTECGGTDKDILSQNKKLALYKTRTWLIEHFPRGKKYNLKKIYKERLGNAKETIVLITPYFMPKRWFIKTVRRAVLRGVRVEILVPKVTNHFFADRVGYFFMFKLSRMGVHFYLLPKMNHAKAMIIDSKEGMVGSNNLDFLSFEFNSEVGIFFTEPNEVVKLVEILANWKKEAVLFDFSIYRPKLFDYFLSPIIRLFARIF